MIMSDYIVFGIIGIFIIWIGYLIVTKQWDKLRSIAYSLMLQAERVYNDNEGYKKFQNVFYELYNQMPLWMRFFLTEDYIKSQLQNWYEVAKDLLK